MKGQISRISHNPEKGYSGVFHIQGGMITDGDLNEAADISRAQNQHLGNDTIRDGVPAKGGIISDTFNGADGKPFQPYLRPGIVYADGVRGVVRAPEGKHFSANDPLALLVYQLDMPETVKPPEKGEHLVYADIWQRTVHPLEDARLAEVAFHGAHTSFRQKTMAQLKTAPRAARSSIENGAGSFVQIGSGKLSVTALNNAETGDNCDPCANEIPLDMQVENALFRIEVVAVKGTASEPKTVALAWSRENAAEISPLDALPDGFEDQDHVYEHTNLEIEQHKGIFADQSLQKLSTFSKTINKADENFYIRRWDGYCEFELGSARAGDTLGRDKGDMDNGQPLIITNFFAAHIDFDEESVMVGDYWLIELRGNAQNDEDNDERVQVVSAAPLGIRHHYTVLFNFEDGKPLPLSDKKLRALSFPTLSDIPANHVSYQNNCGNGNGPMGRNGDEIKNVQQALDQLCTIDASEIDFDPKCKDVFGDADTVEDALNALCDLDFGKDSDRSWMKYVFDWGVVCGLTVKLLNEKTILITSGAYFDPRGEFIKTSWEKEQAFDMSEIRFAFGGDDNPKSWCLGVERNGDGKTGLVIAPKRDFDAAAEPTFAQKVRNCAKADESGNVFDKTLEKLPEGKVKKFKEVLATAVTDTWKTNPLEMELQEAKQGHEVLEKLVEAYKKANGGARAVELEAKMARVKAAYRGESLVGLAKKQQRGRELAEMTATLANNSSEFVRACICQALWPDCPAPSDKRIMVPLAQVKISFDNGPNGGFMIYGIQELCMVACRRQALTPRTISYYLREHIALQIGRTIENGGDNGRSDGMAIAFCCEKDGKTGARWPEPSTGYVLGPVAAKQPRTRYKLEGKTKEAALDMLSGNGVEIAEVLNLGAAGTPAKLAEIIGKSPLDERLMRAEAIGAGDRVVVLHDAGLVRGYLVEEYGNGKYPYTPISSREKVVSAPVLDNETALKLEAKLGHLAKQMEAAEAEASTLDAGISEALGQHKNAFTALSKNIGTSAATLKSIEARSTELQANLETQLATILETGLGDEADAMRDLLGALAKNLGALDTSHGKLATNIETSGAKIGTMEGRVAALGGRVAEVGDQIKEISSAGIAPVLADAEARLGDLRDGISKEDSAMSVLEEQASRLRGGLQEVRSGLPAAQKDVGALSEAFTALHGGTQTLLEARAKADQAHAAQLKAQASQADGFRQKLEDNAAFYTARLAEISQRGTSIDSTISSTEASLRALEKQRSEKLAQAQLELQNVVKESDTELARLGQEVAQTKADLNADIKALSENRAALSKEIISLDNQLSGLNFKMDAQARVMQGLGQQEARLSQQISQSQAALEDIAKQKDALLADIRKEHPVGKLKGATKARASAMAKHGLFTVGDVLELTTRQRAVITRENAVLGRVVAGLREVAAEYLKK